MPRVTIPNNQRETHPLSLRDPAGLLFRWNDRLLREVAPDYCSDFMKLWSSGLIQALSKEGLIPSCELTEFCTERGGIVIEHEEIKYVTYPIEWSFSMLRDAGEHTLRVNAFAARFGYELKDAHSYNIVFQGVLPRFVDIGSFTLRTKGAFGWRAEAQFRASFLNILRLWSLGGAYVARRLMVGGEVISELDCFRLLSCIGRLMPGAIQLRYRRWKDRFAALYWMSDAQLLEKGGRCLGAFVVAARRRRWGSFRLDRERVLSRKLHRVRPPSEKTPWSGYHQNFRQGLITPRVERIVGFVRSLNVRSVLDVACNEGEFSFRFLKEAGVGHVVALDADPKALDRLYEIAKDSRLNVTPVLSDAVVPLLSVMGDAQAKRWKVDAVVALAISHHLLLSQEYSVDVVLKRLTGFSRRHLLVEFMPLGLWNGTSAPPVPEWYRLEWFRASFSRWCSDIVEIELEKNRILFAGIVRGELQNQNS